MVTFSVRLLVQQSVQLRMDVITGEIRLVYMLCANHGSGQSMDCAAQSMDPCFARAIHGLPSTCAIHGLRNHTCVKHSCKRRKVISREKGKEIVAYLSAGER